MATVRGFEATTDQQGCTQLTSLKGTVREICQIFFISESERGGIYLLKNQIFGPTSYVKYCSTGTQIYGVLLVNTLIIELWGINTQ